jgi:hypothetical protein
MIHYDPSQSRQKREVRRSVAEFYQIFTVLKFRLAEFKGSCLWHLYTLPHIAIFQAVTLFTKALVCPSPAIYLKSISKRCSGQAGMQSSHTTHWLLSNSSLQVWWFIVRAPAKQTAVQLPQSMHLFS